MGEPKLCMLLVTPAFLALSFLINYIMGKPAVPRPVHIIAQCAFKYGAVVTEDSNGHHRFHGRSIPVTVCKRSKIFNDWIDDILEQMCGLPDIRRRPAGICIT